MIEYSTQSLTWEVSKETGNFNLSLAPLTFA